MKKAPALLLLVLGLGLIYYGFTKMNESSTSLEIGNIELTAEKSGSKTQSYVMLGGGILCLVLGAGMFFKSKR